MERRITISESDYPAIADWEGEGGWAVEVIYEIVPETKTETVELVSARSLDDSLSAQPGEI